ncbi:hypothetical protein D910_03876 [Dendroctonus ponderosae]|uniref:Kazal-like domain-containing protein n=1 Tax=Dendroctonus ponderosae TaxID=77166 RepID=U4U954_DENPD|nr:hypothetical protein D910_03876 [Dendroctonus ponderosae]
MALGQVNKADVDPSTVMAYVTVLSLVDAAPSKGSTKASLKKKQTCAKDCGDNYKPICAGDGSKNLSFGSECVLSNYNCENQKNLKLVSQGECPGGGGVRLS